MPGDSPASPEDEDAVERRLEDALERVAYAAAIRVLGTAPVERGLVATLVSRYRAVVGR